MDAPLPRGWHSRGYLPHLDLDDRPVSLTYRVADSLPLRLLEEWQRELQSLPPEKQDLEQRKRVEDYLDSNGKHAWLSDHRVASLVEQAFLFHDGERYRLHAWVVMPNHVHVLFSPMPGESITRVVHTWKSFTAHHAQRLLRRTGRFWHPDYFDRHIRNEQHTLPSRCSTSNTIP